ncbi:hypothetical protein EDB85DRAFT_2053003 [Lactarius pseudohatsudake]|nr:hypothetical protein EDB85DRAFT_2053003 [Lactarius pseudohatsudake]
MPPPLPVAPDTSPSCPARTRRRHARAHPSPFAWKGGARGHAAPDTSPSCPHLPSPLGLHHPIHTGWRHARARRPAPPFPIHAEGEGGHDAPGRPVRVGTPHLGPPFPIRAEGGAPSARHPHLPSSRRPALQRHPVRTERGHARASRSIP